MSAFNKFDVFSLNVLSALENFTAHSYKVMLTDVAPVRTNTIKSNITEIAAGNGYTAGGGVSAVSLADAAGVTTASAGPVTFTASGGSIATWRYAVIYNATTNNLVGWYDYGAEVIITATNSGGASFATGLLTLG